MAQFDPPHNLNALTIATAEFSFSPDAVSAADARTKGYIDLGNVVAVTPGVENTTEDHFGSYRGVRRKDRRIVTETSLQYQVRVDEYNYKNLELLYGGSSTTGHTQSSISAASGEVLGFTAVPAVIGRWYEIRSSGGARLRNLTTVTITTKVEGTDFDLDLLLGRIRFRTAQTSDLTPTVTAPAITAGTDAAFLGLTPLADPVKSGFGRLVFFDQYDNNKVVTDHLEFSCDVSVDSAAEVDGTGYAEITLNVDVTSTTGTSFLRNANQNAGF